MQARSADFLGKTVMVTGGAKGIGLAASKSFAAQGANVLVFDADATAARAISHKATTRSGEISSFAGSVADQQDCNDAFESALERYGRLDVLVCSAGIQRYGTVETTPIDEWDLVMSVNLRGAFLISKACAPELRSRKGNVVLVASLQGLASQKNVVAYSTSKHGLIGLTRSMAMDFADVGVRVNAVAPAAVDTPMLRDAVALDPNPETLMNSINVMHPIGRCGRPEEIAEVILFLASDRATFVTGEVVNVDGGLRAIIPGAPNTDSD